MIEIAPSARIGVYEYVGLKEHIASLLMGRLTWSTMMGSSHT